MEHAIARDSSERVNVRSSIPFFLLQLLPLLAFVTGVTTTALVLLAVTFFGRMFFITAGYHRYFAHRSYKLGRVAQFVMAFGGGTACQKGVLWWAGHHRWHHKYSDTPKDVHSAKLRGFWYSHIGWIMGPEWERTDRTMVSDLAKFPELRALDRQGMNILPTVLLALAFLWLGGGHALLWGYFVSTVLLWHGSFAINSLAHLWGNRRYATSDDSRNNWLLALLTTGEGWHNNHHHYQSSANQGFRWWEIDVTFYVLRLLEALGLIWDLRRPPREVVEGTQGSQGSDDVSSRAAA